MTAAGRISWGPECRRRVDCVSSPDWAVDIRRLTTVDCIDGDVVCQQFTAYRLFITPPLLSHDDRCAAETVSPSAGHGRQQSLQYCLRSLHTRRSEFDVTGSQGSTAVPLTDCGPERPSCVPSGAGSYRWRAAITVAPTGWWLPRAFCSIAGDGDGYGDGDGNGGASARRRHQCTADVARDPARRACGRQSHPSFSAGCRCCGHTGRARCPWQGLKCAACRGSGSPDLAVWRAWPVGWEVRLLRSWGAGGRSALRIRLWVDA